MNGGAELCFRGGVGSITVGYFGVDLFGRIAVPK